MPNILDQIVAHKREEVAMARAAVPLDKMKKLAAMAPKPRNFFAAVTRRRQHINVIAEIKKASPSAGVIREDFDPALLALAYHESDAAAISCLTDQHYFQGRLEYIQQIRSAVPLPVLRKDFIIDPYQLYESRAAGADAVLLIAECLTEQMMIDMMILASQLQLTVLMEVHDTENLLKVRPHIGSGQFGCCLLGINNRDLRTMKTDITHTLRMMEMVEDPSILVSESGIRTHDDVLRLQQADVNIVLVGEYLMNHPSPGHALRKLMKGK